MMKDNNNNGMFSIYDSVKVSG